jgi:sortase A
MKDNKITADKANKQNKGSTVIHIATGFIVLAVSVGILLIALIKPYDKLKVYLNIAFMDELKTTPENIGSGLIIKENNIIDGYNGETYENGEFIRPSFGEHYADLKCDVLGFDVPVYWGSNINLFELGACQSSGSVIIGSDGNTVISAHEDTYFNKLSELEVGDKIKINTTYGEFSYTVRELISFKKTNSKYVVPTEDNRLTLYTCKKDVFGSPDERIGVICDLTEKKFYTPLKEDK